MYVFTAKPTIKRSINSNENDAKLVETLSGLPIILSCPTNGGVPPPSIYWFKDNSNSNNNYTTINSHERITPLRETQMQITAPTTIENNNFKIMNAGKTLTILNATTADSAIYYCLAKNLAGESKLYFNVSIIGKFYYL